ncbi:MAG: CehA/McbA family metallohydrolase [Syntrophales bacterium]|jgi:hypothetical protein|nr:CehA/McbA family metallohydrolase [Syntrophales bacterium]MDY0045523.1 CehA/McbA family metallohydrolase [Syntrophales bacterium]
MKLFDQCGAIHLHSKYSFDGRTSIREIMKAAEKCKLDFVMLTDHSNMDAKKEEGWHGNALLIVGQEISPRFNHYIAFGCNEAIEAGESEDLPPQQYIDKVNRQGGFGFIAHPDHEGTRLFHVKQYPWKDWSVSGFQGMGIWDFMTDWQSKLSSYPRSLLAYLCPALVLTGPRQKTLQRWDAMSSDRLVVGIGELDNHDTLYRLLGFNIRAFPFERAFKTIRTHVLTDSLMNKEKRDVDIVLKAIRQGHIYIAMEYFSRAEGFNFTAAGANYVATMGDEIPFEGKLKLSVRLPERGQMRLLKDGSVIEKKEGTKCESVIASPGVYRCEVYQKRWGKLRPWIFSNPIHVR